MDFQTIIVALIGGGVVGFVQFLISRHDEKHDKLDEIMKIIEELAAKNDERYAISVRVRILRFADEMMEGRKHSKDSFDQVMGDITEYEKYCVDHPDFKNNQTVLTSEHIKRSYAERLEKGDFV